MVRIINKTKKDYYWDSVPKNVLQEAKKNWKKSVKLMNKSDYLKDYILNENLRGKLADFMEKKLRISKKSKILDIGAGMGALTIALSRRFNVSATDTNPSTLKFVKYRAEQEKVNLTLYKVPQLHKGIPFREKSFDVVVMNGVLEWVAKGVKGDVRKIQEDVLKEIFRIIKQEGLFIFSIENRLACDWFKGKKSHSSVKYIDLFPRWIADKICLMKKGEKYKTYIYSRGTYEKMLKKVGFKDIKFYTAYPSYQKPKKIVPNKNLFVNSFIIVARK